MSFERLVTGTTRRPVTVLMLAAGLVLLGVAAMLLLSVELTPRGFAQSEVTVSIRVAGGNPKEIQEQVIRPTEEQLRTVTGISEIRTTARPDRARLSLDFARNVDIDLALAEVRDRMERARLSWPSDVRDYNIFRFNLDTDIPVFSFAIDLDRESDELTFLVEEKVIKPLEALPGVAVVEVWGLVDDQIRISIDRDRALAQGVDIYELTRLLSDSNLELSGGQVEEGGLRYQVRTDAKFKSIADVRNFPITPEGLPLSAVASIEAAKSVRQFLSLANNRRSLWCQVYKESGATTVEVADRIRAKLEADVRSDARLKALGADLRIYDRMDFGRIITGALDNLTKSALVGGLLSILILWLFLRRVSFTIVVALSIPVSILMTLGWMFLAGNTLNLLSLLGLTIAVGMLVDNSIVVAENIVRLRDEGLSRLEAARRGAGEVGLAITLSTLTTLAAFLPVIFMGGEAQISFFTKAIGLPLCVAVLASLVVAILFIPLTTTLFHTASPRQSQGVEGKPSWLARVLSSCLRHRLATIVWLGGGVMALTAVAMKATPKQSIMSDAGGRVNIGVKLDENFTLSDAYQAMTALGRYLQAEKEKHGVTHFWCFFNRRGGRMQIDLGRVDMQRTKTVAGELKESLPRQPGVRLEINVDEGSAGDKNKDKIAVFGPEPEIVLSLVRELSDLVSTVPGVLSVTSDLEEASSEIRIIPDRDRSALYGVEPRALRGTLEYGVRGWNVTDLVVGDRETPLIIEYAGAADLDLASLRDFPIPSNHGGLVSLESVTRIEVGRGLPEIRRTNGRVRGELTIELGGENRDQVRKAVFAALRSHSMPQGYSFEDGSQASLESSQAELLSAVVLGITFVFLLMGILFESFLLPLAVIVTIPLAWAGGYWALALTRTPLDFVGGIGVLVLVGVIVNNGIVLIDCAYRLRQEGMSRDAALIAAVRRRLRPVAMTAMTTVVGLIPMAVSDGGGSEISYKALARLVLGGLLVGTTLTLIFVPIFYTLLDDLRSRTSELLRGTRPGRAANKAGPQAAPSGAP